MAIATQRILKSVAIENVARAQCAYRRLAKEESDTQLRPFRHSEQSSNGWAYHEYYES